MCHVALKLLSLALLSLAAGRPAFAQLSGGGTSVGYIDPAPLRNQLKFRFDAAYGNPTPDWAEFFSPRCGCLLVPGVDPDAPGLPLAETNVDYQEFSILVEHVVVERLFSVFAEVPIRLLDPSVNANASGISDVSVGFKASLYNDRRQSLTFQLRTLAPTGDGSRGLGNEHFTIEPAVLYYRQLSPQWTLETELRDFIPVNGTDDWAGNILRYGVGISNRILDSRDLTVTPVIEAVGWSVLNGQGFAPPVTSTKATTTIVNLKLGTRFGFGRAASDANAADKSLYVGYGRSLTGERWYRDIVRAEFRIMF